MMNVLLRPPLTHVIDLILLSLVVLACYVSAEKLLNRFFNVEFSSGLEKFLFFEGIGLGLLAIITFILGLCGAFYPWVFYSLLIFALLASGDRVIGLIVNAQGVPVLRSKTEITIVVILLIFILCALLSALTPPTSIDEMMYHLTVPKMYVMHHKIYNIPEILRASWIMTQEMLFAVGFLLKGESLAKLFHFLMGLLTAMAVYSFSRKYLSKAASLLAALMFYSTPMVIWLSTVGNNDLGLTFFGMLAVYAAVNWLITEQYDWLKFAAVFCGFALGTKYLGGFVLLSVLILIVSQKFKSRTLIKDAAVLVTISLLVAFVWYLRNYLYVQNPIFPFFNNIFNSRFWFPAFWSMDLGQFGMGRGLLDYVLLPWNLTFHCRFFSRVGYIGPIFLMVLPLLLLPAINKTKVQSAMKYLMIYSGIYFVFWALSSQYIRYFIPVIPILSILAAFAIYYLEPMFQANVFKAIVAVVIAVLFLNLPFFVPFWTESEYWGRFCYTVSYADYAHQEGYKSFKLARQLVFGQISRDQYLAVHTHTAGSYPLIKFINENLPATARVLTLDDFLLYYHNGNVRCDYDYFPELGTTMMDLFAQPTIKYYPGMWSPDFLQKLKEMKFTHIMINFVNLKLSGIDLIKDKTFYDFGMKHLRFIVNSQDAILYEVKYD